MGCLEGSSEGSWKELRERVFPKDKVGKMSSLLISREGGEEGGVNESAVVSCGFLFGEVSCLASVVLFSLFCSWSEVHRCLCA